MSIEKILKALLEIKDPTVYLGFWVYNKKVESGPRVQVYSINKGKIIKERKDAPDIQYTLKKAAHLTRKLFKQNKILSFVGYLNATLPDRKERNRLRTRVDLHNVVRSNIHNEIEFDTVLNKWLSSFFLRKLKNI